MCSCGRKRKRFKINTAPASGSRDKQGFIGTLKGREAKKTHDMKKGLFDAVRH